MTIMVITLIFGIFFYVIVVFRTRPDASLLTSSIVFLYNLYLQWSAMASNPDSNCNPFIVSSTFTATYISLGLFFTMLALIIIAASTKNEDKQTVATAVNDHLMEDANDNDHIDDQENNKGEAVSGEKLHVYPISKGTIIF